MSNTCQRRRVLMEIPAPQPKTSDHERRSYLDVLNSRVGPHRYSYQSNNQSSNRHQKRPLKDCVRTEFSSGQGDLDHPQMTFTQQQLVQLIRSLIFQQREQKPMVSCLDLKVLLEDLQIKKNNVFRSIPYSRLGSNRDAHCYRKAYPHLQAFKHCCQEGGQLLLQSKQWESVLEHALVAWRCVSLLPQWDTGSHNSVREQCYSILAAQCTAALKHHHPGVIKGRRLLKRFKMARLHNNLISPCMQELERKLEETQCSATDVTSFNDTKH